MVQVPSSPVLFVAGKRSRTEKDVPLGGTASKHFRTGSPNIAKVVPVPVQQFDELRSLLLAKVGVDSTTMDEKRKQNVLREQYSPRLVHLLESISTSLNSPLDETYEDERSSVGKDVTQLSYEDDNDGVVPTSFTNMSPISLSPSFVGQKPQIKSPSPTVPQVKVNNGLDGILTIPSAPSPISSRSIAASAAVIPTPMPIRTGSVPQQATAYKSDTEIAISRIFDLGKVASVEDPSIPADAPYNGPSVVTMTGFGELGRYGNQMLQYMFLKSYATRYGIDEIQVPGWVGAGLFGLSDRPVQRALPAAVEFRGTVANSTFTTDFIDYVKGKSVTNDVPELFPDMLQPRTPSSLEDDDDTPVLQNVDMWGWFQWHTSHFAPFKDVLQDTFEPVPELHDALHTTFDNEVRFRGGVKRTVVGLHLRLGDYKNIAASSFGYCAPTAWYLSWLERIWPTLENPVLFLASDDIEAVLRDFATYDPITADSINMKVPDSMSGLKAGFFPDWFSLTQCDVLAISNSTFSFTACMMNKQPNARFFRAHYHGNMQEIEPWNADPIVHRDMNKAGLQAALETLQIVYNTQGSRGLAKNILYELPYYGLRSAIMKAVLWRQSKQETQPPQSITV